MARPRELAGGRTHFEAVLLLDNSIPASGRPELRPATASASSPITRIRRRHSAIKSLLAAAQRQCV
jgi:hypothetical protein